MPSFDLAVGEAAKGATSLDVALDLTQQQAADLSVFDLAHPDISNDLMHALQTAGILEVDAIASLEQAVAMPHDWMNLGLAGQLHTTHLGFQEDVVGSVDPHAPVSLDSAFDQELSALLGNGSLNQNQETFAHHALNGVLGHYTTPDNYGDLISALTASGVSDFVVESGNVQVSDALAAALVDAGMLQALPSANLVLDASAEVTKNYAHLATTLKSISDLGVHAIEAGAANQLYVDLGLPEHDASAMADISHLLNSLDPANHATNLAQDQNGHAVGISLVISGDMASAIEKSGGFTADDMRHLENLGINQIAVVDPSANVNTPNPTGLISSDAVSQAHAPLPEVKLIGADNSMYDELHHPVPPHK
jgi:hypothetical protein